MSDTYIGAALESASLWSEEDIFKVEFNVVVDAWHFSSIASSFDRDFKQQLAHRISSVSDSDVKSSLFEINRTSKTTRGRQRQRL